MYSEQVDMSRPFGTPTSLTRIAARADVAKGLVWRYFAGKDDLMESTAKATMTAMRADIVDSLDLDQPRPAPGRRAGPDPPERTPRWWPPIPRCATPPTAWPSAH